MDILYAIVILALIVCLFLVWFFSHRARHQEKLLRIEMGIAEEPTGKAKRSSSGIWLKLAFLITGQGIAFLLISVLVYLKLLDKGGNALPIAIMALMSGLSMLAAHYTLAKKQKD